MEIGNGECTTLPAPSKITAKVCAFVGQEWLWGRSQECDQARPVSLEHLTTEDFPIGYGLALRILHVAAHHDRPTK